MTKPGPERSCGPELSTQTQESRPLAWLIAEEKVEPGRKKNKKKLQQLLEVYHQNIQCNG